MCLLQPKWFCVSDLTGLLVNCEVHHVIHTCAKTTKAGLQNTAGVHAGINYKALGVLWHLKHLDNMVYQEHLKCADLFDDNRTAQVLFVNFLHGSKCFPRIWNMRKARRNWTPSYNKEYSKSIYNWKWQDIVLRIFIEAVLRPAISVQETSSLYLSSVTGYEG